MAMTNQTVLKLRYIATIDFRSSEMTNYLAVIARQPHLAKLSKNDAILFISRRQDQLIFVHGFGMASGRHSARRYLRSERLRLEGGCWEPLMLQNYARNIGLHLEGLKTLEEHLAKKNDAKKNGHR